MRPTCKKTMLRFIRREANRIACNFEKFVYDVIETRREIRRNKIGDKKIW